MLTLFADLTPAAAVSGAIGITATVFIPVLLLAGAEYWAWPSLRPLIENRAGDRLLAELDRAKTNARHTGKRLQLAALNVRDRARLALYDALLTALRRHAPKGNTR